ncbi:MAG: sulfurtransferase [Bacteroidales bacterium]|nr:sulfurtransferase [Bacteroidales bacterium]
MKKLLLIGLFLSSIFLFTTNTFSQGNLISAKETAKIMKDDNVVLVSTRKAADYAKVHITDAVNIDITTLCKEGDVKGILKSPEELSKELGAKGLNADKKIIIYDNGKNVNAGRLYWILEYLGFKDVKILDGHMKAWRAARKKVTKFVTKITPVTCSSTLNKDIITDYKYVKTNINNPKVVIVDVRSQKEYDEGHITNAKNFEYKNIVVEDKGTLKSVQEIEELFNEAGLTADKEIILYCATSARAGIVFLAMKSLLKYPNVKIYDGAYNEWKTK